MGVYTGQPRILPVPQCPRLSRGTGEEAEHGQPRAVKTQEMRDRIPEPKAGNNDHSFRP